VYLKIFFGTIVWTGLPGTDSDLAIQSIIQWAKAWSQHSENLKMAWMEHTHLTEYS